MNWRKTRKSLQKLARRWRCRFLGGHRILVLGDSHAGVFEYLFDHDLLPPHLLNCDIVGGATAYGLNNDHSVTGAFLKYQHALRRFFEYDVVIVMLGEVDCSFALWHRASQRGEPVAAQIPRAIQGICRLLDWGQAEYPQRRFVLAGSILPTIKDYQITEQEFALRRQNPMTQRERTALVLRFNEALAELAALRRLPYIDITAETLDSASGVVGDQFLVEQGIDHHQSQARTAPLWTARLERVLAGIDGERA